MNKLGLALIAVVAAGGVIATQTLFTVPETHQAVVLHLGTYVRTASEPGLYAKLPFVQQAVFFDRRLLSTDATPQEYLTLDKKRMRVDHVTRWRIEDPLQFLVSVQSEAGARARLDDIVFSELRRTLATHNFGVIVADERDPIMETVTVATRAQATAFGIAVVDVRIKRADLPKEVEQSVFARMQAERSREANRYRAEGEEQGAEIRASADRERVVIIAEAQEQAARTRGQGDAEAIRIYAEALNQDPEFFAFRRRLEAYERVLRERDVIVVPPNSDFFSYLGGPRQPAPAASGRETGAGRAPAP
jgi:membrane protease subunit HflC